MIRPYVELITTRLLVYCIIIIAIPLYAIGYGLVVAGEVITRLVFGKEGK